MKYTRKTRRTTGCTADRELAFLKLLIDRAIAVNRPVTPLNDA
jgi:hypothetical protein